MDNPTRRSAASQSRSSRRSTNASPYARSKSVKRLDEVAAQQQPASSIPRTSSIRSLFNMISSPFRAAAPPAPAPQDSDSDGFSSSDDEDADATFDNSDIEDSSLSAEEGRKFGQSRKGKGREDERGSVESWSTSDKFSGSPASSANHWAASNPMASFSPRVQPHQTHAHAPVQMEPSPSLSQPKYLKSSLSQSFGPGGMTRSSTMPSLNAASSSRGDTARRLLREAEAQNGIAEVDLDNRLAAPEVQRLFHPAKQPQRPSTALKPLFHPGSVTSTPPRPSGANQGMTRSSTKLSFLSPSRFSARPTPPPPSAPASPSSYSFASRPGTGTPLRAVNGTPGRRRPIYVGPGVGSPMSARKKTPAMALEFLREAEKKEEEDGGTPGKRRRIETSSSEGQDGESEEVRVERELSGLFGGSSSSTTTRPSSLSSSVSVPSSLSTHARSAGSSSPFTFKVPPAPAPQPAPLPSPAPAPQPKVDLKRSFSTLPRSFLKNPSLVAPSPLRQSTSFGRDSPEFKSNGQREQQSPLLKRKERTESAKLLLGLINEDKQKTAPALAPPVPILKPVETAPAVPSSLRKSIVSIQNPYQSSGLASPSPRRNPRRSAAATNRSKLAAASPIKKREGGKPMTALELIEQDVRAKAGPDSPLFAGGLSKRQTEAPIEVEQDMVVEPTPRPSPTPIQQPKPVKANDAPPAWASTPQPVVHFAPSPNVSSSNDAEMTTSSPTKDTLEVFKNLKSPAFGKTPMFQAPPSFAPFVTSVSKAPPSPPKKKKSPSKNATSSNLSTSTSTPFFGSSGPRHDAAQKDKHLLPIFTFVFWSTATPLPTSVAQTQAIREAKVASKDQLPKFDLFASANASKRPVTAFPPVSKGFDFAAAGMKAPAKPAAGSWTCGTCSVTNKEDQAKCVACEDPAPKKVNGSAPTSSTPNATAGPSTTPAPATGGFNWAAAGIQTPPKASSDTWTCGVCCITNNQDKAKCLACEEPKPKSKVASTPAAPPPPAPATGGFNWPAAGIQAPPKASSDTWTCGVCCITNSQDKAKCLACEEIKPKSTVASTPAPTLAPASTGGGFNWAAAGMAPPSKKSGWDCGVCMVHNDVGDKCVSCESPK